MKHPVRRSPRDWFAPLLPALALATLAACGDDPVQPENTPPVSAFSFACTELTCTFTNESTDAEGPLVSAIFSFGDGTSTGDPDPTHTYQIGGDYTAGLTVQDTHGERVRSERLVRVNSSPTVSITSPNVDFALFELGEPITFSATGSDRESATLTFAWFHVTGGKSDLLSTSASFTTTELPLGMQLIQVTAADGDGATAQAFIEVEIQEPIGP